MVKRGTSTGASDPKVVRLPLKRLLGAVCTLGVAALHGIERYSIHRIYQTCRSSEC